MFAMTRKPVKLIQRGFTLIELLIVVIILAILAAILIPQVSSSTADAQEAALDANLNGLRSAIELYQVQHGGLYPGEAAATGPGTCSVGAAGAGAAASVSAVIAQLTMYSNAAGATCTGPATQTPLGPYVRKIPVDPITNSAAIAVSTAGTPLAPGAATGGWAYDAQTGQIVMNSNALDSDSRAYSAH